MTRRSSLGIALIVVGLIGIGVGTAQLTLRDDGVQFPDGTVQTTAAETPGIFVQGQQVIVIDDLAETATGNLVTVPSGMRLRIEWVSVEIEEFADSAYAPVDIEIGTWNGGVQVFHTLARLDDPLALGSSLFPRIRFSTPVTLYSEADQTVQVFAQRNNSSDQTNVSVSFQGQLFAE